MEIIVFDLETTGTDTVTDRIVQISAQKFDKDFLPVDEKRTLLINPLKPIPAEASAVHGITDEMVADKPTFASYANSLLKYFSGCAIFGYNLMNFDVPLLSEEFARREIYWPTTEPIVDAYKIWQLKEPRTLAGAVKFYTGGVFEDGHDAGRDVDQTVNVLKAQMASYEDVRDLNFLEMEIFCRDGKPRVDLSGKFTRNSEGVIVYAFGKDKDKPVKENPGFGNWMLGQSFPSDTKNILRSVLNGKLK